MSRQKTIFFLTLILTLTGSSCSSRQTETSPPGALPRSWFVPAESRGTGTEDSEKPSPETDAAVRSVFQADTSVLADLAPPVPGDKSDPGPSGKVPWHLDGLIADFTVATNGIFGALLSNGTYAIKGTWQRPHPNASPAEPRSSRKQAALVVRSDTTPAQAAAQLEPAIRSALAAGLVLPQNAAVFRSTLLQRAEGFLSFCQALGALPAPKGWRVDALELQLTLAASGQVTPVIGAGSTFNLFFEWQKSETPTTAAELPRASSDLSRFAQLVTSAISEAERDTEQDKSSLPLKHVQFGVGMTAGGSFAFAQVQGVAQSKLTFTRQDDVGDSKSAFQLREAEYVSLLAGPTDPANSDSAVAYRIPARKFQRGLRRAIKIGRYFAKRGAEASAGPFQLTEIEAEFDVSVGGEFSVATVSGAGMIVLDFDRPGP